MDNVINLFGKIIAYLGGASVIILALSSWIGKIWSDIFIKKQEIKYQKDIECYKNQLSEQLEILKFKNEKINHISKTQFDVEFKIYQELSEASFSMLLDVSQLFPYVLDNVPENKEEQQELYKERFKKAKEEFVKFQNKLFQVAPFISKEIYDLFEDLRQESRLQVLFYPDFVINPDPEFMKDLGEEKMNCWKRTPKLNEKHNSIIEALRDYLSSLKVNE